MTLTGTALENLVDTDALAYRRPGVTQAGIAAMEQRYRGLHKGMTLNQVKAVVGALQDEIGLDELMNAIPQNLDVSFPVTNGIFSFEFYRPTKGPFVLNQWLLLPEKPPKKARNPGISVPKPPSFDPNGKFVSASGIEYKILRTGNGKNARNANHVMMWQESRTASNHKLIDSSYTGQQPVDCDLSEIRKGLEIGIRLMRVGDIWLFKIPPELAYGAIGSPPEIGPNETLYFTIELVNISE